MKFLIALLSIIPFLSFAHQITEYNFEYQEENCKISYSSELFTYSNNFTNSQVQYEYFLDYAYRNDIAINAFLREIGEHFYYLELNRSEQIDFIHRLTDELFESSHLDWQWFIKSLLIGKISQSNTQLYLWQQGETWQYALISTNHKGIEHQVRTLKHLWKGDKVLLASCEEGSPIDTKSLQIFDFQH